MSNKNRIPSGIHYGMDSRRYHAWELDKSKMAEGPISGSSLKGFLKNPYAWRWTPKKEVTTAMQIGSLFDYALTEPSQIEARCVISPHERFQSDVAKAWKAENIDKIIITEELLERANKAAKAVREHDEAGAILESCDFQVAVVRDIGAVPEKAIKGIPGKCLIDILPKEDAWDEIIWDYKTTSGIDDEAIRKTMGNFSYHHSAAFYRSLWNKASKDRHCERFGFIFQDRDTLEVRTVILSDDAMAAGTRWIKKTLIEFKKCATRGIRSRYAKGSNELNLMPYHEMNEEDHLRALDEGGAE